VGKPQAPQVPPLLTVPRSQFGQEVDERIQLGQKLRDLEIRTDDQLSAARNEYYTWDEYNAELLRRRFTTSEVADRYRGGAFAIADPPPAPDDLSEWVRRYRGDVGRSIRQLESIKERIALFEESPQARPAHEPPGTDETAAIKSIFIVHGHDKALKLAVHGFLRQITDVEPVILHDQPNRGRTILEKFEAFGASAGYAIVLLTADDVGGTVADSPELQGRARQNVVWEFGFFAGALGRSHVAVLYEDRVELPSDVHGLAYIPYDDAGGWKLLLARELKAAGVAVDTAKLI
jgi:predicted nucleotide-binding protein